MAEKINHVIYLTAVFLVLVTAFYGVTPQNNSPEITGKTASGIVKMRIETDIEEYILGESFEARIVYVNEGETPAYITPVNTFSFNGESQYAPTQVRVSYFIEYLAGVKIEIPPKSNWTFKEQSFTPEYPGPYIITCLNAEKTVMIRGYKMVSLNSTGISLEVLTNKTDLKVGDIIETYLVIKNSNPYPVKIPVYEKFTKSAVPLTDSRGTVKIEWVMRYFEVEANSTRITWRDRVTLRVPHYSVFYYVDGAEASLEIEVRDH